MIEIIDQMKDVRVGRADTMDGAKHYAWGYLMGIGQRSGSTYEMLAKDADTQRYMLIGVGHVKEEGPDWKLRNLQAEVGKHTMALERAQLTLEAYTAARTPLPKVTITPNPVAPTAADESKFHYEGVATRQIPAPKYKEGDTVIGSDTGRKGTVFRVHADERNGYHRYDVNWGTTATVEKESWLK